jgi:hypothetical protein
MGAQIRQDVLRSAFGMDQRDNEITKSRIVQYERAIRMQQNHQGQAQD